MWARQRTAEAVYQDPRFFRFLAGTEQTDGLQVATLQDKSDVTVGVIPLRFVTTTLKFSIGQLVLAKSTFGVVSILGSEPMVPADDAALHELFSKCRLQFANCAGISLAAVETNAPLWRYLTTSPELARDFFVYVPYGPRQCHSLRLPGTFEEYLKQFSAKKRHNINRQIRLLREHGNGELKLRRIDSAAELPELFSAIETYFPTKSTSLVPNKIKALAAEGLLLCYILVAGDQPCAMTIGVKSNSTYRVWKTNFDQRLARLSPGSTLLHLLIEDLIENDSIRLVDLGYGSPYANSRANVATVRAEVLLLRKTLANRLRMMCHFGFWSVSDWVRKKFVTENPIFRIRRSWRSKFLLTSVTAFLSPDALDLLSTHVW
jgi:hypothetical protein